MKACWFVIGLLCCWPAWATTRYATPSGGATTGTCPIGAPCTLDRVRSISTAAGDIAYLNPGRYTEGINTGASPGSGEIKFECLGNLGDCILDGMAQGATDRVVQMDSSYYTLSKLTIIVPPLGAAGSGSMYGVRMEATGSHNKVVDSEFYSEEDSDPTNTTDVQWAIQPRGTAFTVTGNSIHNVNVGINANTDSGVATGLIDSNTIWDLSQGDEEDADCINVGGTVRDAAYGLTISHNDCSGFPDDGVDLLGGTNVILQDNYIHDPAYSTTANSGIKAGGNKSGSGPGSGNIIRRNRVDMRSSIATQHDYGMVVNGLNSGRIESNLIVADGTTPCIEVAEFGTSPAGGGDNNSILNNTLLNCSIGIYVRASATGTTAYNNIADGVSSDINVETGVTLTGYTNRLAGTGTKAGGGTYTDTGDTTGDPGLQGGALPDTAEGFCLKDDSALIGAGTWVAGYILDYNGRGFGNPPNIGATTKCSDRAPAESRPAAW